MAKLIMTADHFCYQLLGAGEDLKLFVVLSLAMPMWMNVFLFPTLSDIKVHSHEETEQVKCAM